MISLRNLFLVIGLLSISQVKSSNLKPANFYKALYSKGMDGWRIGGGLGTALYMGDQMDYTITRHYGVFNELKANITLGVYKNIDIYDEYGFVYKHGGFQTLKSDNSQYVECFFDEIQMNFQKSLNGDVGMHGGRFTCNLQYGFGVMYYKARYGSVNTYLKDFGKMVSSIGYGMSGAGKNYGNFFENIPSKRFTPIGNIGLNIGVKINRNLAIFWENSLQISLSNKLSGNLSKNSSFPPDCYFYSGLSFFYYFGMVAGRLNCPSLHFGYD